MNHSPEPWQDEDGFICDSEGFALGQLGGVSKADRARIVACVNACAGIPTEDLAMLRGLYLADAAEGDPAPGKPLDHAGMWSEVQKSVRSFGTTVSDSVPQSDGSHHVDVQIGKESHVVYHDASGGKFVARRGFITIPAGTPMWDTVKNHQEILGAVATAIAAQPDGSHRVEVVVDTQDPDIAGFATEEIQ